MSKINVTRVILGGLVAGVLINIGEFITHGVFLKETWQAMIDAGKSNPEPAMLWCVISRFGIGGLLAWLYAAVRPRLGGNPKTALIVAVVGSLLVWGPMSLDMGLFGTAPLAAPLGTFIGGTISGIVGLFVAAWLYKE